MFFCNQTSKVDIINFVIKYGMLWIQVIGTPQLCKVKNINIKIKSFFRRQTRSIKPLSENREITHIHIHIHMYEMYVNIQTYNYLNIYVHINTSIVMVLSMYKLKMHISISISAQIYINEFIQQYTYAFLFLN